MIISRRCHAAPWLYSFFTDVFALFFLFVEGMSLGFFLATGDDLQLLLCGLFTPFSDELGGLFASQLSRSMDVGG